jgi:ATP-binding cassette subfamily B protein
MAILKRFMRPYRMRIILMLALLLLQALGTLFIPTLMAAIVDHGILAGDMAYIRRTVIVMLVAAAVVSGISIAHIYISSHNAALIGRDIRNAVFKKTQELSFADFGRFRTASMITRTDYESGYAADYLDWQQPDRFGSDASG